MQLQAPPPQDVILVGGTGDLAQRKLLPAIYNLELDGLLPAEGRIIGFARSHSSASISPSTCSTSTRPYHQRSKITSSPRAGICAWKRCRKCSRRSRSVAGPVACTTNPRG